jgi:hypothetical protein
MRESRSRRSQRDPIASITSEPSRRAPLTISLRRHVLATIAICLAASLPAHAQGYYNLDAGRPGRVEDASPTPRYELELQLMPVRFERFASGATRWRTDPKLSYGVAPFTEIELRVPLLQVNARGGGGRSAAGIGGVAIGGLHALTLETGALPAVALAGEWIAPVGGMSSPVGSYSAKVVGTKTLKQLRVHLNAGFGTWSLRPPPPVAATCPRVVVPGTVVPPGCGGGILVPDTPCDRVGDGVQLACIGVASALGMTSQARTAKGRVAAADSASVGYRWVSGLGVDRAFPLASTLVSADVVAERFIGLYDTIDWSVELGLRHQLTPTFVVDVGIGRHFAGAAMSNAITAGITYGAPRQSLRERGGDR